MSKGDLISRSKMIELVNKHINEIVDKDVKEVYESFINFINRQPTAYSVEKVVAELEEKQESLETDMWAKESDNWYGQYCNGMSEGYQNAIDIVKKCGVESEIPTPWKQNIIERFEKVE